jgi:hypothetical protein
MSQPVFVIFLISIATIVWLAWRSTDSGKGKEGNDRPRC